LPEKRNDPSAIQSAPIKIGKNVWIALDCVILRGVTIGDNSTISARSVVYGDVPEYSVYGGNPAALIKKVEQNLG
jgi:acetyltransferase-like isoleucine patch superfamily enzyme